MEEKESLQSQVQQEQRALAYVGGSVEAPASRLRSNGRSLSVKKIGVGNKRRQGGQAAASPASGAALMPVALCNGSSGDGSGGENSSRSSFGTCQAQQDFSRPNPATRAFAAGDHGSCCSVGTTTIASAAFHAQQGLAANHITSVGSTQGASAAATAAFDRSTDGFPSVGGLGGGVVDIASDEVHTSSGKSRIDTSRSRSRSRRRSRSNSDDASPRPTLSSPLQALDQPVQQTAPVSPSSAARCDYLLPPRPCRPATSQLSTDNCCADFVPTTRDASGKTLDVDYEATVTANTTSAAITAEVEDDRSNTTSCRPTHGSATSPTASTSPSAVHHDGSPQQSAGPSPPSTPTSADVARTPEEGERGGGAAAVAATAATTVTPKVDSTSNSDGSTSGGGIGDGPRSYDGRVRVLCRFRGSPDTRGGGRGPSPRYGGGVSDWLSFQEGTGAGEDHEGGEGGTPDTVSVRMGYTWSTRGFDKVFRPGAEQEQVYREVKHVAQGVSQGFNGTIFVYGQTGSGKTYTMGGSAGTLSFMPALEAPSDPSGVGEISSLTPMAPATSTPSNTAGENLSTSCGRPSSPTTVEGPLSVSPATIRMPPPPPPLLPLSQQLRQQQQEQQQQQFQGEEQHLAPSRRTSRAGATCSASEGVSDGGSLWPEAGVIPRAVSTVLADAEARRAKGWEFVLTATYVEIYNEKIRDLLDPCNDNLQVKESPSGLHTAGATEVRISTLEEAVGVLQKGAELRATAATLMNSVSSRSHSIFMLRLDQRDVVRDCRVSAQLTLVDLAGSERAGKTGVEGKRREEAHSINLSLHTLGRVIRTLSENGPHVPFRDSKLTRLLQESLGGNSRTVLIICCSSDEAQAQETVSTLKFGECAKRVTTFASANVVAAPGEVDAQLAELRAEVIRLKRQLLDVELREMRRNEAAVGGRRLGRSSMGTGDRTSAGGGAGISAPVARKWGVSPLARATSLHNASPYGNDLINSSGDESWPATINNGHRAGGWEHSAAPWNGEPGGIVRAPSPSTPREQRPMMVSQSERQPAALVSPPVSPDGHPPRDHHAGPPLSRTGSLRGQEQFGRRRRRQPPPQPQSQLQQPRWGSAAKKAPRPDASTPASKKKSNSVARLKRTRSGYSSARSDTSARVLWSEDDVGGTITDSDAAAGGADGGGYRPNSSSVGPAEAIRKPSPKTKAAAAATATASPVDKVTLAASGEDGVRRFWRRRRSWSGNRIVWSQERPSSSPRKPRQAARAEGTSKTTKRPTMLVGSSQTSPLSSPAKARVAASGSRQAGGDGDGAREPRPAGTGDIRKAAEGGAEAVEAVAAGARARAGESTSSSPCSGDGGVARGEGEGDGDTDPSKNIHAMLAKMQGLEKRWAERVQEYEKLLQLKDLRIESLMLLHKHVPLPSSARADCSNSQHRGGSDQ